MIGQRDLDDKRFFWAAAKELKFRYYKLETVTQAHLTSLWKLIFEYLGSPLMNPEPKS